MKRHPHRPPRGRTPATTKTWVAGLVIAGAALTTFSIYLALDEPSVSDRAIALSPTGALAPTSITWLGDTMLGNAAQPLITAEGVDATWQRLPPLDGDVVVANLESPITLRTTPFNPDQTYSYEQRPEIAAALGRLGIDVVGLANNHAMDRGPEGLADTLSSLDGAGVLTFGAGTSSADASLPLLVETANGLVATIALADVSSTIAADEDAPGAADLTSASIHDGALRARQLGARWIVGFVHWGENYEPVDDRQRRFAQIFADAGYDLVIGTGPHLAHPLADVDGMPVLYSIGNFIFGTPGRYDDDSGYSLIATTTFASDGSIELATRCLLTNNEEVEFRPRPCGEDVAETVLAQFGAIVDGSASITFPSNG